MESNSNELVLFELEPVFRVREASSLMADEVVLQAGWAFDGRNLREERG